MSVVKIGVKGRLRATIITPDPDACVIEGVEWEQSWKRDGKLWRAVVGRDNAFVNSGLQNLLNRWALGTGTAPTRIAVSSDNAAVTAASTTFGGTFRSSTMNATFPSLASQTMSFQSDFTKGSGAGQIDFSVRKIGLTTASTDAASAVQDIIGGGGVSPYNEALTIDLTSTTSFTLRPQIDVSLTAV